MAKQAAILRWTGRGSFSDLQDSVRWVLKERRERARVKAVGETIVVSGPGPVEVCTLFENMPGVAWEAAGFDASGQGDVARVSRFLAAHYLKRGTRFSVLAEAVRGGPPTDLAGAVTSAMLERVKGSRATAESPRVRFRAARDGRDAVVGVEVYEGPGGVPTGSEGVACLASGGIHSSVLAWSAALSGFRVNLVHARTGEESLRAAAKLYSELSHRMDPRGLSLKVLDCTNPAGALANFSAKAHGRVFGGFTPARPQPRMLGVKVEAPLFLLPEESFVSRFDSLGIRGHLETTAWGRAGDWAFAERSFGGKISDVSGVLDGLA